MQSYLFVLSRSPAAVGGVNEVVLVLARELATEGTFRPIIGVAVRNRTELTEQIRGLPVYPLPMHDKFGEGMTSTSFACSTMIIKNCQRSGTG